jgi:lipid-A-disaccharide synthase
MVRAPHYVLVAGEPSGDVLGADLIKALKTKQPHAEFSGVGGQKMISEGLSAWFHIDELSVNGFVAPLMKLPFLIKVLLQVRSRCRSLSPAAFIGIDFNFFNLLLAGLIKKDGTPTVHYVSPSVWAWRQGRIKTIQRRIDLMLTLYPFETAIYEQHGIPVRFVGHPRAAAINVDELARYEQESRARRGLGEADRMIALLPGSRNAEVASMMPIYLDAVRQLQHTAPDLKYRVAAANERRGREIERYVDQAGLSDEVTVEIGDAMGVMAASNVVLVNAGTATLEALLLRKPMLMAYRLGPLTYAVVSRLVTLEHFALPNILAGEAIVDEYLQARASGENLAMGVNRLLLGKHHESLMRRYDQIHQMLIGDLGEDAALPIIALAEGRSLR